MSAIDNVHDAREIEDFYQRWGPDVFIFCRLFLGDEREAERIASRAFLAFYRHETALSVTGEVPSMLVGLAFKEMQPCQPDLISTFEPDPLRRSILSLDCRQRAVFIMRNVLAMSWAGVANATHWSVEEVRQYWTKGMLRVRELLPRDFFER